MVSVRTGTLGHLDDATTHSPTRLFSRPDKAKKNNKIGECFVLLLLSTL